MPRVDHHAGIEEACVRNAVGGHPVDGGHDDLAHDPRIQRRGNDRCRRVRSHPARVRPLVAVPKSLVVLRRRERQHIAAVRHHDEARLLADEKLLDDDAGTGRTQRIADEHRVDRRMRFGDARRDDDPFAGGESVGLDDDRRPAFRNVGTRRACVGESPVLAPSGSRAGP